MSIIEFVPFQKDKNINITNMQEYEVPIQLEPLTIDKSKSEKTNQKTKKKKVPLTKIDKNKLWDIFDSDKKNVNEIS